MNATTSIANRQESTLATLRFITCGSVDDGKSTLIGRLLVDSRSVMQDQLAGAASRVTQALDLALLTDGLTAEREQGITIDVAYRYFATARRKFIIGDTPGHEQYTRNMVTAASTADAAVVLVDATKTPIDAQGRARLLPQTRRHALLAHLLRVPALLFVVNKLDAVARPTERFEQVSAALKAFAQAAGLPPPTLIPISALRGDNVAARAEPGWCGYTGPALLEALETLDVAAAQADAPQATPVLAVQWIEQRPTDAPPNHPGTHPAPAMPPTATAGVQRVLWCQVAAGAVAPGQSLAVVGTASSGVVTHVLNHRGDPVAQVGVGHSAGIVLGDDLDVSRGDWLGASGAGAVPVTRVAMATLAWLDDEALAPGRPYWALHGRRWVKVKVARIVHRLDIETLAQSDARELHANDIAAVELSFNADLPLVPYTRSRRLGALILVDMANHRTVAAALIQ